MVGSPSAGWFQFQPLFDRIVKEQPDLLNQKLGQHSLARRYMVSYLGLSKL